MAKKNLPVLPAVNSRGTANNRVTVDDKGRRVIQAKPVMPIGKAPAGTTVQPAAPVQTPPLTDDQITERNMSILDSWSSDDRKGVLDWLQYRPGGAWNIGKAWENWASGINGPTYHDMMTQARASAAYQDVGEKHGEDVVARVAESADRAQNKQLYEDVTLAAGEMAEGGSTTHDIFSVLAQNLGSYMAPLGFLSGKSLETGQYAGADPYNWANIPGAYSAAVRAEGAEHAGENLANAVGNVLGFDYADIQGTKAGKVFDTVGNLGYQGIMTWADSALRAAQGAAWGNSLGIDPEAAKKAAKVFGSSLAAMGTFGQSYSEYSQSGIGKNEAALQAFTDAAAEFVSEYLQTDRWFKVAEGANLPAKEIVKNFFKNMGAEIAEEEISLIVQKLSQLAILGENAEWRKAFEDYREQGMNPMLAMQQVMWDFGGELAETAGVSIVSSILGSGGATIAGVRAANRNQAQQAQQGQQPTYQVGQRVRALDQNRIGEIVAVDPETGAYSVRFESKDGTVRTIEYKNGEFVPYGTVKAAEAPTAAQPEAPAQTPAEAPTQAPAQTPTQTPARTAAEAPAVVEALEGYRQNNRVSNNQATAILADKEAVAMLTAETGMELPGTASGNRAAVKAAVAQLAQTQTQNTEAEAQTAKTPETAPTEAQETPEAAMGAEAAETKGEAETVAETVEAPETVAEAEGEQTRAEAEKRPPEKWETENLNGIRDVLAMIERGAKPSEFEAKARAAAKEYEDIQAAKPYGTAYTDDETGRMRTLTFLRGVYASAGRDPVGTRKMYGALLEDVEAGVDPEAYKYDRTGRTLLPKPVEQQEAANPLDRAIGAALRGEKVAAQPEPVSRPQTVDTPKQSPSGAQDPGIKGTGAAEANFSGKQQFENLLGDDNVQPDRASDTRPAEMIRRDAQGRRVSDTAKNAVGADVTTEEVADAIQELAAIGAFSYEEESNRKAMETAGEEIAKRGARATEREILNRSLNGKHKKGDIEKAMLLYARYNQKGDVDGASEMMVALTAMANRTGRDLQLFRMMRKLTPEGQLMTVRKTAQQAVDRINRGRDGRKQQEITPKQQLENDYIKAVEASMKDPDNQEKQEAVARAERAIYEDAASQIKATFADKWNAWRYMAMLGNMRTQVRNVVGNLAFVPYKTAKDTIGSALERMFLKQENRTKAVLNFTAANDRDLVSWAAEDGKSRAVHDALKYSAKLGDDNSRNIIEDSRKIFNNKALEAARKFIEKVPQAADMWFKSPYYATSLASFLKARGYTAQQVKAGQVSDTVMQEARSYAIEEAMRATFNDSNAFSDAMANLRYKGDNRFMKLLNIVGEGVLPFRRTPANVLMRGLEYSPAGLIKTGVQAAEGLRNGDFSGAQFIDNLSANITGSAAMLLGYALAKGMLHPIRLRGGNVDEDEERRGIQEYAIEFQWDGKTYSYTIDWAAPANLPLFVGANIYEAWSKDYGDDISGFTRFLYAVGNTFEPMLELACLSSLADLAESISYGRQEGNVLYSVAAQIATSYLTQGIPALLRQGHYAAKEDKQTTFANNADPLLRGLERTAANMPIVGSLWQTTKRDAWGRAQDMGGIGVRILNSFVNPGTFRQVSNDPVEAEIARLNRVQSVNVSPDLPGKTITYRDGDGNVHTDHRLTEGEWQTLVTTQGQTAHELLTEIVESDAYQSMDDDQRAAVIEWVYDYARETARDAAIRGYEPQLSGWMKDLETFGTGAIFSQAAKREMDDGFTDITAGNRADGFEKLSAGWDIYQSLDQRGRERFLESNGGRVEYYIHAREAGMSTGTFGNLYTQYRGIDGQDISISQKANAWANTLQKEVEAGHITAEQAAVLKKDMVFRYSGIVSTTNYDAMVSAGLEADSAHGVTNLLAGLKPEPGKTTVRDVQNAEAIAGMGMDEKSTVAAMHVYLSDAQDKNLDQMIGMGYSPEDYAAVWRIYLDATSGTGKKNRVIEAIMRELNIKDYKTAAAIYDIYAK